VKPSASY